MGARRRRTPDPPPVTDTRGGGVPYHQHSCPDICTTISESGAMPAVAWTWGEAAERNGLVLHRRHSSVAGGVGRLLGSLFLWARIWRCLPPHPTPPPSIKCSSMIRSSSCASPGERPGCNHSIPQQLGISKGSVLHHHITPPALLDLQEQTRLARDSLANTI